MDIVRIFEDDNDCLLSFLYDEYGRSEFERLFSEWRDIEKLEKFFSENEYDLKNSYWKGLTTEKAIRSVLDEVKFLAECFIHINSLSKEERVKSFLELFKPLDREFRSEDLFERKKVYGGLKKNLLRIYALRIGKDMYIITGGTIKLTKKMQDREHTRRELRKFDKCKQFLINEGIYDEYGVLDVLEC